MTASELFELVDALQIPKSFSIEGHYRFTGIEALCILCAHFHLVGDMYSLAMLYDCSQSAISECINELVKFLDEHWEHLLKCDSKHLLHPSCLSYYAEAIHNCGAPLKSVFAFIDSLMLPNGIIGHLYGPHEGQQNDNFLLTESALIDCLAQFAFPRDVDKNTELEWNAAIEHGFEIVLNTWPFLNSGWKMHLYASCVGQYYCIGVLLTNCMNCL
ncbi:hypothetical protein L208DRAFT_1425778 [Tricholoma matsutake]|nr:hypothetical protein L208DRAFT_1425778 [Tricholoma matsutake 945]